MKNNKNDKDIIQNLQRRITEIERQLKQVQSPRTRSVPVREVVPTEDIIPGEIFMKSDGGLRYAVDESTPYLDILSGIVVTATIDFNNLAASAGGQAVIDLIGTEYEEWVAEGDWCIMVTRPAFSASRGIYFYTSPAIETGLQIIVHGFNADGSPIDQPSAGGWRFLVMKPGAWLD